MTKVQLKEKELYGAAGTVDPPPGGVGTRAHDFTFQESPDLRNLQYEANLLRSAYREKHKEQWDALRFLLKLLCTRSRGRL